jgi:hypothetical protein
MYVRVQVFQCTMLFLGVLLLALFMRISAMNAKIQTANSSVSQCITWEEYVEHNLGATTTNQEAASWTT